MIIPINNSFLLGLIGLFFLSTCNDAQPERENSEVVASLQLATEVYDLPGGEVIAQFAAGESLPRTGRVSERLFPLYANRDTFFEPYLEVLLPNGHTGWVYARPGIWGKELGSQEASWRQANRIRALLGEAKWRDYQSYRQVWAQAMKGQASPLLVQAYRTGVELRNALQTVLVVYPEQPLSAAEWEQLLPGFVCQLDEGGQVRWWVDYRQWLAVAQTFNDEEASMLFSTYCAVYPQDSMEYYYPVWRIAESREVQHSLLGRGIHTRLLRRLEPAQHFSSLAGIEAGALAEKVIDDILSRNNTFWESREKILQELDTLLYSGNPPLDKILGNDLQRRRQEFEAAAVESEFLNMRAGQLGD